MTSRWGRHSRTHQIARRYAHFLAFRAIYLVTPAWDITRFLPVNPRKSVANHSRLIPDVFGSRAILRPMRRLILVAALLSMACGGSPTGPGPTPNPQPTTVTISGRVTTTLTGEAVAGATLSFSGRAVSTSADGKWSLDGQNKEATLPVEVTAPGYLTRVTTVKVGQGRSDITIDLIRDGGEFSLAFYRQLVRDGFDSPNDVAAAPLRRWTKNPNFYIQTLNPKTGTAISAAELASLEAAIVAAVPQASGGTLSVGSITSGVEPRTNTDTVSVVLEYDPSSQSCGRAVVGANPGRITLNYDRCPCGGLSLVPETMAHEVGHALGLQHTNAGGVMDTNRVRSCGNTTFSPAELFHARIAYSRPVGNMDLDRDASGPALLSASGSAQVVQCFRR